jgi:uncharacterized protein (TIGR02266 family)
MFPIETSKTYLDGQIIFEEGSSGDGVYVIQSGKVEISRRVGGEKIVIEVLQTGEIFGELGFISQATRSATARVLGATTVGMVAPAFIDQELNKLSTSFKEILSRLTARLKKTSEYLNWSRKDPRVPKVLSLTFKTKESLIKAYTENASGGGIFIKTPEPLAKGARLFIGLNLPEVPEPIKIEGEVVWSRTASDDIEGRPLGMGVQFIHISRSDYQKLKESMKY